MSRSRRNATIAVTILIAIVFATLIGGWYSTGSRRTRKRPLTMRQPEGPSPAPTAIRPARSAKTAAALVAADGDTQSALPRFQRDRLWAPETPAEVFPYSGAHAAEDFTTVDCVGGANPQTRTCRIYNACFDSALDNHGSYEDSLVLFTGDADSFSLGLADGSRHPFAGGGEFLLWHGTLFDGAPCILRPAVRKGRIPADQVLKWYDEPLAMFGRHYPDNYAHAIGDDWFPLWWLLTTWMGWSPDAAAARPAGAPPSLGGILFFDTRAEPSSFKVAHGLFTDWFPGVGALIPKHRLQHDGTPHRATKPLTCFRSLTAGTPGLSMMRNAGYAYHQRRTWDEAAMAPWYRRYVSEHSRFVEFVLGRYGLPGKAEVNAELVRNGTRSGSILLINRRDGKRELKNANALLKALDTVSNGRRVEEINLGTLTVPQQISALMRADLVIGIHSAGSINVMYMRPGTAFIDLLPPRGTNYQPVMLSVAQRYGVRFFTMPLQEEKCGPEDSTHDQPFYSAAVDPTRALAALVIGQQP